MIPSLIIGVILAGVLWMAIAVLKTPKRRR